MNLINLFPLTIIKDKLKINSDEKNLMINEIRSMKKNSKNLDYQTKSNAWTGDTQGHEFLHKNPKFDIAFYFDCSLKKSAYRRYVDLKKKIPLKKVLQNLRIRRLKDRTRRYSALKKHKKAVLIRSDLLSKRRMILKMAREINKVIKKIKN